MIARTFTLALLGAALALPAAAQDGEDWRSAINNTWRVGILGGENEADRLKNYQCFADKIEELMGVEVELYPASDYAGVIQGLISGNLESAELGSSGFANVFLQDEDAVEPIATYRQTDGSTGYYSVMVVRAESDIQAIEDMKGRSLAFADPNSTSGYLVPSYELRTGGYDPESYFASTGFSGGHEQGIVALLNGQYDAAVTWSSMVGDREAGYSNGNLHKMVEKGALDMDDVRIIWQSNEITNGPVVVRQDVPEAAKAMFAGLLYRMPAEDYACFTNITGGEAQHYVPVGVEFYRPIIEMRKELTASRRG